MTLTPMDLFGQFILCKTRDSIPEGWVVRQHDEWYLGSHPTLPVTDILAADSSRIGWLLGWAISPYGVMVKQPYFFNVRQDDANAAERLESALYDHGGRWAVALLKGLSARFYLDPSGSLAAVFCAEQQMVASTPTIIPRMKDRKSEENREVIQAIESPGVDTYCPFGLTPRRSVERLLPNHLLDLSTWETNRHWPPQEMEANPDVESAVSRIGSLLKADISAIAIDHGLHMPLTAGRDSRMLLACAREHIEDVVFFTLASPVVGRGLSAMARLNCQIGRKIAKKFELRHVVLPYKSLSAEQYEQLLWRTGGCVRGPFMRNAHTYEQLEAQRAVLFGAVGEIGRSFHWRKHDCEFSVVSVDALLEKREIPATNEICHRAQQWLDSLPVQNALTIWGLAYIEHLTGSWFSPLLYGLNSNALYVFPFSRREILEALLKLPMEYRQQNRFPDDLITSQWPELLGIPFNWPVGFQRYLLFLKRHCGAFTERFSWLLRPDGSSKDDASRRG